VATLVIVRFEHHHQVVVNLRSAVDSCDRDPSAGVADRSAEMTKRGDGHVLTFGTPTPTGYLDLGSWTVSGVSHDVWFSTLTSLHEAAHAGLNYSTAWGRLLHTMWLLPGRDEILKELVDRCFLTHEAFATHTAIMRVIGHGSAPDVEGILTRYPTYDFYFKEALKVGPPAPIARAWRGVAADAALAVCMQADVLTALSAAPLERFTPSRVSDRQSPDTQLKFLCKLGVGLWDGFDQVAEARFGRELWVALRSVDLPVRSGTVGADERGWLYRLCSAWVAEKLRAAGRPTLDTPSVLAALPRIVDEIGRAPDRAGTPFIVDHDPTTLFDLEHLRLRAPLPVRVRDIVDAEPGHLAGGDPPGGHVLLTVRRAGVLRRQFALRDDPLPADCEPVVAVRVRTEDEVVLYQVRSPEALSATELANIALTCARDHTWEPRWKDSFDRAAHVTILLDLPFSQSLDALLTGTTGFRYAVEPLLDETTLWAYVCAVDGHPPLVLPCSMVRAAALRSHTRSRTGGQDPMGLSEVVDEPEAVLAAVRRIVADESVVEHHQG
jgi:hypothetical protein